jgi:hypothetical protein
VGVTSTPERPAMDRPQGLQLPLVQVQLAVRPLHSSDRSTRRLSVAAANLAHSSEA